MTHFIVFFRSLALILGDLSINPKPVPNDDCHQTPAGLHLYYAHSSNQNVPPEVASGSSIGSNPLITAKLDNKYGVILFHKRNTFDWYMQNIENGTWGEWKKITFA